jgi:hypothetical protein
MLESPDIDGFGLGESVWSRSERSVPVIRAGRLRAGYVCPASTCWALQATPELLAIAAHWLEQYTGLLP